MVGALYGLVAGLAISVVPTAIAGSLVTALVRQRHPHPAAAGAVRRDLGPLFCSIVLVLDVAFLVAVFALGDGLGSVVRSLPLLAVANATIAGMLWWARTSIARAWSEG